MLLLPRVDFLVRNLGLGLFAAMVSSGAAAGAPAPASDALAAHARSVLHQIMDTEQAWVRIHAAEALMAAGESGGVRADFLRRQAEFESSKIRVGVWRVLAATAPTPEERAACVARIERIYLDPAAPDHPQAIETLCKLGHHVTGPVLALVRREAAGAPSTQSLLALWSAQLADEPGALGKLTALLASPDPALRGDAGYALRWLHGSDPAMRQALVRAAAAEPADTTAYPYLLGAALTCEADPAKTADWEAKLDHVFMTGVTDARFEASWTLMHRFKAADLPRIAAMLDLPAKENDTRVGAATIILTTLTRQ